MLTRKERLTRSRGRQDTRSHSTTPLTQPNHASAIEYGSCIYEDPHGKFSVGWKHLAGKVKAIYFSRGPNKVAFKEATLVKFREDQVMVLDTQTGEFRIAAKANGKAGSKAETGPRK